jgi:hypothetical protein
VAKLGASIPEALWELFLDVYCTVWGFRRAAPILSRTTTTPNPFGECPDPFRERRLTTQTAPIPHVPDVAATPG